MQTYLRALVLILAAALAGCSDESPTGPFPTPTPAPGCPFTLEAVPIAGAAGFYHVQPNPAGDYVLFVNGSSTSLEFGVIFTAASGDVISGCRPCGCTTPVTLR